MASQVTGYRYFANFLLFIGNPIEKVLGINFDKRGWISPLVDENGNALVQGVVAKQYLYGETEGGIGGAIHARYGTNNQDIVTPYKNYMESMGLQASAYPFQSYLAFTGLNVPVVSEPPQNIDQSEMLPFGANNAFYVGNSGYMKEMLLWPKRIHVRNDGRPQWYDAKAEVPKKIIPSGDVNPSFTSTGVGSSYLDNVNQNTQTTVRPWNDFIGGRTAYSWNGVSYTQYKNYAGNYPSDFPYSSATSIFSVAFDSYGVIRIYGETIIIANSWSYYTVGNLIAGGITSIVNDTDLGGNHYTISYDFYFLIEPGVEFGVSFTGSGYTEEPINSRRLLVVTPVEKWVTKPEPFHLIDSGDLNPIHKIREILTDDTAMNKPESFVNDVNFTKAANRIWDEGLGISCVFTEKNCLDAINEICYHIEAGIRVNRQTGLYEMVLFRDDWFEEDEIHTITENRIKKGSMQYEITNADEVINQVNVNYYDRDNIKNSSFSISESGLIQTLGRVNAETLDFPYFMNMRNAEIVANWKLKILSTGVLKGSFTTGWREARKWNRYDLIRLPWSRRWAEPILVRIMNIKLGSPTSNEVSIEWVEVVPATGMMNTTIVADDVIDKPLPPQPCQQEPFELPYYLAVMSLGQKYVDSELEYDSDVGLVGFVAEKPQSNSLNAQMIARVNSEDPYDTGRVGTVHYSKTADLDQKIRKDTTQFIVKNNANLHDIRHGTLIRVGIEWLNKRGEWMVFMGQNPDTGVVTVKRGALDTIPVEWVEGAKLYFCGDEVDHTPSFYLAGETVYVAALTTTPSGVLDHTGSLPVLMNSRAIRPYPPANVKINGEYWPIEIETDLIITWVDRNRVQQTGGEIVGWYEGGVTIENGVEYIVELYDGDDILISSTNVGTVNTATVDYSAVATATCKIKLYSVRDGYESFQSFEHEVTVGFNAPYDLQGTWNEATQSLDLTWDFDE